jgi:uncharacterized protein (TIGR02145 family)
LLGSYCYYGNYSGYASTYGNLYNWYAVNDPRSIAPVGWHVATINDYFDLIQTLGGEYYAGGEMKANSYVWYTYYGGTNNYGFSALPAGQRSSYDGSFALLSYNASFWTSSMASSSSAIYIDLVYNSTQARNLVFNSRTGLSVRLVKD